ncbi:tyrosine-type recombinase/integrase [Pseudonocardia sp. CA-107938]|uniref:tyrosine-type recombinase/integrase n=1 Tax=Pseudonocardia sp. CA-107938 TaxID=3240021 RepID=UPI003D940C64
MSTRPVELPVGVAIRDDIEHRPDRPTPYRARLRWNDPLTRQVRTKSQSFATVDEAQAWIDRLLRLAHGGVDPVNATFTLAEYGDSVMPLAVRGLESKTLDPYLAGWHKRVVPSLGHINVSMITNGLVDRAVHAWITDECSRSTVKNSLAILVRVMEQAVRDGIIDRNPARVTGWQRDYQQFEDELDDPRALALPDWATLVALADELVARSTDNFSAWGEVVIFAACTAARIGEVSGCRVRDIDTDRWIWTVRRQTTPSPGGLMDKGTKGNRARAVPLIAEIREMVERRVHAVGHRPDARLFTGPRGGRIATAVLRDATHWDEVVAALGYEHLRRHSLRHTGLTWMADAGVPVHVLRKIAGHGNITTTQRYLHPDAAAIAAAGDSLTTYLNAPRIPAHRHLRPVRSPRDFAAGIQR